MCRCANVLSSECSSKRPRFDNNNSLTLNPSPKERDYTNTRGRSDEHKQKQNILTIPTLSLCLQIMSSRKSYIIALFSSIFLVKVSLCVATLCFQSNDNRIMNSLIMQVEIEHDDHSNENTKEVFAKESKYTKQIILDTFNAQHYESTINKFLGFSNLYPINSIYSKIVTPPPEA